MKVEVEQVLHMVGGSGETSYATNSRIQENAISRAKHIVEESISDVYRTLLPKSLSVADLGCSSGPTAFTVIANIMAALSDTCGRLKRDPPEILFFLNDLPGNDFNSVFKSLAVREKRVKEELGVGGRVLVPPYYVVGAPGSFYGRLFPKESIHFMHSSYSLHWLSQVPQGLDGHDENIYITRTSPTHVCEAYLGQFRRDFSTFLRLRAEEMVAGGQMVLTTVGRTSADPRQGEISYLLELLTEALNNSVSKGLLDKANVDEFNMPIYAPSMEEVKEVIRSEGSFDLLQVEVFVLNCDPYDEFEEEFVQDNKLSGQNAAKAMRAALEPMFASQFGEAIIDTVFSRYAENVARQLLKQKPKLVNFTIALKKRS